jgi:ATP-dependent Clp protease ATP-binding subunit ClpA
MCVYVRACVCVCVCVCVHMTQPTEKYEVHHGVRLTDGALVAAAVDSDRYITDRYASLCPQVAVRLL